MQIDKLEMVKKLIVTDGHYKVEIEEFPSIEMIMDKLNEVIKYINQEELKKAKIKIELDKIDSK